MPDEKLAVAEPPAPVTAPAAGQAPATPAVPVETPKPVVAAVPPKAEAPVVTTPPTEQLLASIPEKPTVEGLKLPKDHFVPADELAEIVSQSKSPEEAQSKADLAQKIYAGGIKRLDAQNNNWLSELKADPELGGQNWEETKTLYQAGVVRLFGKDFAQRLAASKLDAMPELVRGIVRAERAAGTKPIVKGEPTPAPEKPMSAHERIYGPDATYNETNPAVPLPKPRF